MRNRRNYYRILHVQPDAPREIIHMSYLTLMRRLRMHPDLGGDHWNAAVINEAYATLEDPERRAAYDRTIQRRTRAPRPSDSLAHQSGPSHSQLRCCAFCNAPYIDAVIHAADACCDRCQSPLHLVERIVRDDGNTAQRAIERMNRRMPVTFSVTWPKPMVLDGTTEDLSIAGMLFTTDFELLIDERLKIDCAFCSAVGIVRHIHLRPDTVPPQWRAGVEFLTLLLKEIRGGFVSRLA